jgi:CRISPR/Cas system CSM-associated protein Csm3 (group 7 of RAMP superfamily)
MKTFLELTSRYRLHGVLHADEALHIGTGVPSPETDAPVIREHGQPFLPGSSLRGAMRSTVERIARTLWGWITVAIRLPKPTRAGAAGSAPAGSATTPSPAAISCRTTPISARSASSSAPR